MNNSKCLSRRVGGTLAALCTLAVAGTLVAPIASASEVAKTVPTSASATGSGAGVDDATSAQQQRPGLISADKLRVVQETGEWDGDEPVMMTVRLESVLGQRGSTRVSLVNNYPGQIAGGVDAGDEVGIPDREGDTWINNVKPLTTEDVGKAITDGTPVPIPVVMTATVMLEGDFSNRVSLGQMGQTVVAHLQSKVGPELEKTEIKMTSLDQASGYSDALDRIETAAKPGGATITLLIIQKIQDWVTSMADPDDPVGVSVTALVPVDSSVTDMIDLGGGPSKLKLDDQYMRGVHREPVRTSPFNTDIEVRSGLLVPPSALGGREQQWWTTYSGDYMLDDPVKYEVWSHAWPTTTW